MTNNHVLPYRVKLPKSHSRFSKRKKEKKKEKKHTVILTD